MRNARAPNAWWYAVLLITIAAVGLAVWSEHIPLAGGGGWDGQFYARVAGDVLGTLRAGVDPYRLQRIAPAATVHAGLRLIGAHGGGIRAVVSGFQVLNCLCLAITALLWGRVARAIALGTTAYWLGVVGLFVNYAVLKMAAYDPVLNDMPALCLGMAAVWAFVEERPFTLAAVGAVGAFTWPVAAPLVALLLAFPRRPLPDDALQSTRPWLAALGAAVLALAVYGTFVVLYYRRGITVVGLGPVVPVYRPLALVSVACAAGYAAGVTYGLVRPISVTVLVSAIRRLRPLRVTLATAVVIGPGFIVRAFAHGPAFLNLSQFWSILVLLGSARPLVAPVAHVAYFGPVLLLLVPLWRLYVLVVHRWGLGATLATLAGALIALGPESRQNIFALPLVIAPLCVAADGAAVRARFVALSAGMAVLLSQVWLRINTVPLPLMAAPGANERAVYDRYFMNQGPYMTNAEYCLHALAVAGATVVLGIAWVYRSGTGPGRDRASRERASVPGSAAV